MTDHKTVREALEFYANQKAYRNRNPILDEFDPEACIHGAIHDDKGKRATEALAALDRIEATQPPQTTDAQRQAAMRTFDGGFDSYEKREYADNGPDTGKAEGQLYFFWPEQVQQIKSALQSPAVPREVVDALRDLRGCCNLPSDNHFKQSRMKKADEALALLGGKEG